jgi:hypothetical protein
MTRPRLQHLAGRSPTSTARKSLLQLHFYKLRLHIRSKRLLPLFTRSASETANQVLECTFAARVPRSRLDQAFCTIRKRQVVIFGPTVRQENGGIREGKRPNRATAEARLKPCKQMRLLLTLPRGGVAGAGPMRASLPAAADPFSILYLKMQRLLLYHICSASSIKPQPPLGHFLGSIGRISVKQRELPPMANSYYLPVVVFSYLIRDFHDTDGPVEMRQVNHGFVVVGLRQVQP